MKGELILQAVFFLGGLMILSLAWRMYRLSRKSRLPSVYWWVAGYAAIGLSAIGTGVGFYCGDWIKGFASHLLLTGGVAAVWIGFRLYLEGRVGWPMKSLLIILLLGQLAGVFWFYFVDPVYQVRLTITCVVLLILSASLSKNLFLSRMDDRAVMAAGICYFLFALLNGLRTLSILINPVRFAYYLSGPLAVAATSLMLPVILAAQAATLYTIRDAVRGRLPKPE